MSPVSLRIFLAVLAFRVVPTATDARAWPADGPSLPLLTPGSGWSTSTAQPAQQTGTCPSYAPSG